MKPSTRTVAEFLNEWLIAVEPTVDSSTWQSWRDYARAYVIPRIGGGRLQTLSEPELLKLCGRLLTEGRVKRDRDTDMYEYWTNEVAKDAAPTPRAVATACDTTIHAARAAVRRYQSGVVPKKIPPGLAPKTVRNVHAMRHRALVDAVAWKYITDNPASNVKPPKVARTRRQVWTTDDIQRFLASIQGDRFAALFLLELTTGVRRGQVCGLKWTSVDLDAGEITVHDNRVVVGGRVRNESGGKTKNADQTISIDRATSLHSATGRRSKIKNVRSSAATTTLTATCSLTKTAAHRTRTRSGSDSTASPPPRGSPGSPSTICATRMRPAR